mgnify:CR=1 FL=1
MIDVDLPRHFLGKVVIIKIDELKIIGKLVHFSPSSRSPQHKPGLLVQDCFMKGGKLLV